MKSTALVAALLVLAPPGCRRTAPPSGDSGPKTEEPQPPASASASVAVPSDPCRIGGGRRPLLARWSPAQREALEAAMRAGTAVLAADDCNGMRLLADCHPRGRYGYLGSTLGKRSVELDTEEELRINAPLAEVKSAIDGGPVEPIRVEIAEVGVRSTTRAQLGRGELTGHCAGATHYVFNATIGAMLARPRTKPAASAPASACLGAHPGDAEPPAGCRSLVEIGINPIAELGELVTFDHAPENAVLPIGTCPVAMVVSGSRCKRPPVEAPYLCAFGDAAECQAQCDRGDNNSCDVLGFMRWHGKGVAKDLAVAAAMYARSCERDDSIACANLGELHYRGDGVAKDQPKAAELFDRSCKLGNPGSCGNLGVAYLYGAGVASDPARGISMLARACDAGSAGSCDQLARALLHGDGGKKDEARARAILEEACDGNNGTSCTQLGLVHYLGAGVPADHVRAATVFTKACRIRDAQACVQLALQYRQADGVERDDVLATRLLAQACNDGSADGCHNLGIAYEHGKGTAADPARAASLYEQACNGGNATACQYFGDCLRDGLGVKRDPRRAQALYQRACALGEKAACQPNGGTPAQ